MAEFTLRLISSGAETVVLISPHAPLDPSAFVAYQTHDLYGDFENFRAPETTVEARLDEEISRLNEGFEAEQAQSRELHADAVPMLESRPRRNRSGVRPMGGVEGCRIASQNESAGVIPQQKE